MTLEALLKRHGYHVDTAVSASQGLKLLKSNSPSLVLLDLQLQTSTTWKCSTRIERSCRSAGDHSDRARFAA